MSGLFGSLSIALTSLSVSQQEMAVTGNNVANANTPGYSREIPAATAGDPIIISALSFGTGVVLQKIESLRDTILEIKLHQETQQQSKLSTELGQLQQIQTQFGSASTAIGAHITNLFNSPPPPTPDPANLALRQGVLTTARNMASDFNTAAHNLQTQRSNLELNV